jgi:hypothetical protein
MSAPHVAGAAALYLEANPTATPAAVATALTNNATQNVVTNPGTGSPNRLLYTGFIGGVPGPGPSIQLIAFSGNNQTDSINHTLPLRIIVSVRNANTGAPIENAPITWTVPPPPPPPPGPSLVILIQGGNNQTGPAGSLLPGRLVVRVVNGSGAAVPGVTVTFTPDPGHGTVTRPTALSGEAGYTWTNWRLGPGTGTQRVTASAPGATSVVFTATAN